jgi:hypothetical protein
MKSIFFPHKGNSYRPKFLNGEFLFYYAAALLLLKLLVLPFLFSLSETVFFADLTKTSLVDMTNVSREQSGFQSLKENPVLNQAAYLKAQDMIEKDYFAHYSPEGVSPWHWLEEAGYDYRLAGENLAIGFLESEQVHTAWMDSLSHKENILNAGYQEVGIAVAKGDFQGKETTLVVQFFATPKTIVPQEKAPLPSVVTAPEEKTEEALPQKEEQQEQEQATEEVATVQGTQEIQEETQEEFTDFLATEEIEEEKVLADNSVEKTPALLLFQFMTSDYYDLIQKIIYASLALIILFLVITVFCDIFIYHKFEIQYKDAISKTIGFAILWFVLLFLDKMIMIEIINPQAFMIY